MIVATAGHIDHGKTLLIKTLTNTDTDRLPEEKARGISIDLGFAYMPLPDGGLIGFVDVPGHERFVRNMLAGVCGIDYALLVIAADDGPMPQTVEHFNIVSLLNVQRGAVVISKIDRVSESRLREVQLEITQLVGDSIASGFPVLPVSARDGTGIDALRSRLLTEAVNEKKASPADQHFRFAVDRAFVVSGSGTVVTGTVFNGMVRSNDKVLVSGKGSEVRVRGIQIHGVAASEAKAGQRCALNLSGSHSAEVARGDWVLHPAIYHPGCRLDVQMSLLPAEKNPLKHWSSVHLHLGSADVLARVAISAGKAIVPGGVEHVQLVLERPVCALRLDRFILRDHSAARTIGGGVVLDPMAGPLRRRDASRGARMKALAQDTAGAAFAALVDASDDGVDLDRFERICNLTPEAAELVYRKVDLAQFDAGVQIGLAPQRFDSLQQSVLEALRQFHMSKPKAAGQSVEALRKLLSPGMKATAFAGVLRAMDKSHLVQLDASIVRLYGYQTVNARPDDERLWQQVHPALEAAGLMPPPVAALATQLGLHENTLLNFLQRKTGSGHLLKVADNRFYLRSAMARLALIARTLAKQDPDGLFTVAQCRDESGAGRQAVINALEFLDELGITQREGHARRMGRDPGPIFGDVEPYRTGPDKSYDKIQTESAKQGSKSE